jgi:hypothetical protein
MNIKESNGYLLVKWLDYTIGKFNETKPGNSGIVYCNYVPKMVSHEEMEEHERKFRAGKTYAKVKLAHPNPSYRGKRGIIWETKFLNGEEQCLLEIETLNTTRENGCTTWIGVTYPTGYTKIWFPKAVLEDFETYDENGELVK